MSRRRKSLQYWSLGNTTIRNPERIIGALRIINKFFSGKPNFSSNNPQQAEFFKYLLTYTPDGEKFVPGESKREPIYTFENEEDLSMDSAEYAEKNGRVWLSVMEDFGFIDAYSKENVEVLEPGIILCQYSFLEQDIWLRQLLKYQFPNHCSYLKDGSRLKPVKLIFKMMLKYNGLNKFEIGLCQLQKDHDTTKLEELIEQARSITTNRKEEKEKIKRKRIIQYFSNDIAERLSDLREIFNSVILQTALFNTSIEDILPKLDDVVRSSKGANTHRAKLCKEEIKKLLKNNEKDFNKYKKVLIDYVVLLKGDTAFKDYQDSTIRYSFMSGILIKQHIQNKLRFNIAESYQEIIKDFIENKNNNIYGDMNAFFQNFADVNQPELLIDDEIYLNEKIDEMRKKLIRLNYPFQNKLNEILKNTPERFKRKIEFGYLKYNLRRVLEVEFANNLNENEIIDDLYGLAQNISSYKPLVVEFNIWKSLLLIGGYITHPSETRNFNVDEKFQIIFTAPGKVPDLQFLYEKLNLIIEVTKSTGKTQWRAEAEPVPRHVAKSALSAENIYTLGLFLAPSIHEDTWITFYSYSIPEGPKFNIHYPNPGGVPNILSFPVKINLLPLTFNQFNKLFRHILGFKDKSEKLISLLRKMGLLVENSEDYKEWRKNIQDFIENLEN